MRKLLLYTVFLISLIAITQNASATNFTWTGAASTAWSNPTNWSGGSGLNFPGSTIGQTDNVSMPNSNATIVYSGTLVLGSIGTITVNYGYTMNLSLSANLTLTGALTSQGNVTLGGTGTFNATGIIMSNAFLLTVNTPINISGDINLANSANLTSGSGGSITTATLTATAGSSTISLTAPLVASGLVSATTCSFSCNAAATISAANMTFTNGSTFTTAATVTITSGGTLNSNASVITTNSTSATVTTPNFTVSAASSETYTFMASVNVTTLLSVTSGSNTFTSSNGSLITAAAVTVSGTNNPTMVLNMPLKVTGMLTSSGAGSAVTTNSSGVITAGSMSINGSTFTLGATATTSGNVAIAGTTSIAGIPLFSANSVTLSSGTLTLNEPLTSTNAFTIGSGATLTGNSAAVINAGSMSITGATVSLQATASVTGNIVFNSGTNSFTNSALTSAANLNLAAGTLTINGNITATSAFITASGSTLNALITTLNAATLQIAGTYNLNSTSTVTTTSAGGFITTGIVMAGSTNINFAGAGTIAVGGTTTMGYQNTIQIGTSSSHNSTLNFSAGAIINGSGNNSVFNNYANLNFAGTSGSIIAANFSFQNSGINTYSGGTTTAAYTAFTFGSNSCGINNAGAFTASSASSITLSGYQSYITNSGTFNAGASNSACTINLNGQQLNNTTGANIYNSGTFFLGSTSVINFNSSYYGQTVYNAGTFTLQSDAYGSGSISQIYTSSAQSVSGSNSYNVQRYMSGGALARRGYRLLSGPVNQTTVGGQPAYGFTDLQATTIITGGNVKGAYSTTQPTNNFDPSVTGNPSIFYYYEPNANPTSNVISTSDYKGLNSINEHLPIGNGFLFFFRGDRTATGTNAVSKFSTSAIPQNTTLNYNGTINQGAISVYIPTTTIAATNGTYVTPTLPSNISTTFTYTNHSSSSDGFHLLGNPYPCAIDLESVTYTTPFSTGNNYIYMLNNAQTFGAYDQGTGSPSATLNNGVGRYVLSGQGFFVRVSASGGGVTFNESNKVSGVTSSSTLYPTSFEVMQDQALATINKTANGLKLTSLSLVKQPQVLHITLALDSFNVNETVIQFNQTNSSKNKFDDHEDAYYIYGLAQTTFMASYTSDGQPCLINQMGSIDSIKTMPLYAEGQTTGLYTMTFDGAASIDPRYKIYLKDNLLKDSLDLFANKVYTFNIDRSNSQTYGQNRFTLVFYPTNIANYYHLSDFSGVKQTGGAMLNWTTQYEGDYTGFVLQRSTDGFKTFTVLDSVQSNGSGTYNFLDTKPFQGVNQYRLVQNNINNVNSLSNIVTISYQPVNSITSKFQVYPNPAVSTINLNVSVTNNAGTYLVKVYNSTGIMMINNKLIAGNTLSQDVSKLIKGTYVIQLTDSNGKDYGTALFTKL